MRAPDRARVFVPAEAFQQRRGFLVGAEIERSALAAGQISSNRRLVDAGQPARVRRAFLSVLEFVVISTARSYADNVKSKASAPSQTQPRKVRKNVEESIWETNKIRAMRVRQTVEHGRALVEDLRYTLALSQRLVQASRALLKRSKDQGVANEP